MKRGYFIALIGITAALLLLWLGQRQQPTANQSNISVLNAISPDALSRIALQSQATEVVLEREKEAWVVPARENYPADANKVRSLLLKLFGLESSQSLPTSPKSYEKLGVAENSHQAAYSRVDLFLENDSEPVESVLLGKTRESGNGQYLRLASSDKVVLVAEPLSLDTTVSSWLEKQVVNVREAIIYSIEQRRRLEDGSMQVEFSLDRGLLEDGLWGPLSLRSASDTPEEMVEKRPLEESLISQIRGALENMKLSDVALYKPDAADVYDQETVFSLSTGIEYTVATAVDDAGFKARVSVAMPDDLLRTLNALSEKSESLQAAHKAQQSKESVGEKTQEAETGDEKEAGEKEEEPFTLIQLAKQQELEGLQKRFSKWIYTLPEFQGKKFRFSREELFRKEVAQ